jgi:hypothetical protein
LAASPIHSETVPPSTGLRAETVLIRTVLEGATSLQGHAVTVMGKARDVEKWPPLPGGRSCRIVYDSYIFTVEDESGSIRVEVMGSCGIQGKMDVIRDGEPVLVEGIFIQHLSGNFSSPSPFIYASNQGIRRLPQ